MATETGTTVSTSTCVGPDGSAIGLPQLCFDWWPNQIFWIIITLVAIFLILNRVALPRIAGVLAERSGTISNDIAAAEEYKRRAAEAEKAYEKALADARSEANAIAQKMRDEIKAELDEAMAKADEEIAAKTAESEKSIAEIRETALQSVEAVAKDTAGAVVAALGQQADQGAIDSAVEDKLKG